MTQFPIQPPQQPFVIRASSLVSDLRQSRRLDEGGAAQSRTALRAALRTAITTTTRSGLSLPARNEWGESRREGRL
jgi:hypothetical protein